MKEKITLTPYIRAILLEEICRRVNIINYCRHLLGLSLEKGRKNTFAGDCPFCHGGSMSFTIHKATGKYQCGSCGVQADFLDLVSARENIDLNSALQRLSGYLEGAEERETARAGGVV